MGAVLSYSLCSAVILACLYLAYKIAMAGERQFALNRAAIFLIYVLSLAAPLALGAVGAYFSRGSAGVPAAEVSAHPLQLLSVGGPSEEVASWPVFAIWVYMAGAAVALLRYIMGIARLSLIISKCRKIRLESGYTLALTAEEGLPPFSWMKYIVVSEKEYERGCGAILAHEHKHLGARHWLDITLGHLMAIFQWYNPASWLLIEELKTVHEYQADEAVIESGADIKQYQYLLIKKAVGERLPSPANSLNHSNLKKRVTMMYKSKPSPWRRLAALAIVPALAAGVGIVSIPAVASVLSQTEKAVLVSSRKVSENSGMEKIVADKSSSGQGVGKGKSGRGEPRSVGTVDGDVKIVKPSAEDDAIWVVNGEVVPFSMVEAMNKDMIESITVNKKSTPTVEIVLKSDVTLKQALETPSTRLDEVRVVGYGSAMKVSGDESAEVVKLAEYPGGMEAMMQYLAQNIRYPEKARDLDDEGVVLVRFTVSSTGDIEAPAIINGISESLNEEAIRVVRGMPRWTPARNAHDEPVASEYSLPVSFKLK